MPSPLLLKQRESPLSRPRGSPRSTMTTTRLKESSPWNRPLRSPRGTITTSSISSGGNSNSPRGTSRQDHCCFTSQHVRCVLMCSFPLLLLLQSSITFFTTTTSSPFDVPHHYHHRHSHPRVSASLDSSLKATVLVSQSSSSSEKSYNYVDNPIVPKTLYTPHSQTPLPVVLVGRSKEQKEDDSNVLLDGLERSRYIQVIQTKKDWLALKERSQNHPSTVVIHMVDWGGAHLERDCHVLEDMYHNVVQPKSHMLVYFDQTASTRVFSCPTINALFHNQYRVIKQSIVQGRHWDSSQQWVKRGKVMENTQQGLGPVLHAPHFVRESFVQLILEALQASQQQQQPTSLANIVSRPRKLDVVHIWRKGDSSHYGRLRRQVSLAIQQLNGTKLQKHSLRWLVRPQGDDDEIEQGIVQPAYVLNLLSSKIVVVAQRDEWEDHFRLMESLASGALVLTDEMLAAPHGLKNGTNVIVYKDIPTLQRMILYYAHPDHEEEKLAIAQNGFNLAMGKHRSWHRMEQLLFGAARSHVNKPLSPAPQRSIRTN